jgi:glucose-6-phosphate dehydrogenase assembly protein OpcA
VDVPAPRATSVAHVERELEALMRATAEREDPQHPVIRACMSNLLVFCRSDREAAVVMTELPEILALNPARALVLVADETAATAPLEAWVSAHCHMREGAAVCGESVTLAGPGGTAERLPSTARALLIGDLPTTLWWATPAAPALGGTLYTELQAMAHQVVFDSLGWLEPVRGMAAMARLRTDRPLFMDVRWRRLKAWRRILSQGLDPTFAPGAIEAVGQLVLEHGPHAMTQAWLLVGWLACRLGWRPEAGKVAPGSEATWRFQTARGPVAVSLRRLPEGPPEIRTIRVSPAAGRTAPTVTFEGDESGRLAARSDGAMRTLTLPMPSWPAMVARQLSDLEPDPLFQETLAIACQMAAALPH